MSAAIRTVAATATNYVRLAPILDEPNQVTLPGSQAAPESFDYEHVYRFGHVIGLLFARVDSRGGSVCSPYDNQIGFSRAKLDQLPADAFGVYGLWYGKRCIYVGKAEDQTIATRLVQHWRGSHNPNLANWIAAKGATLRVAYAVVNNKCGIDELEQFYIRRFQPLTNRRRYENTD